jgi:hypothetical protein
MLLLMISNRTHVYASYVWSPDLSFVSIAIEQWRVCQAASSPHGSVLLSFDTGMEPRPVEVYLQKLFCGRLNVTVLYPFNDAKFQAALWGTRHPRRCVIGLCLCLHS